MDSRRVVERGVDVCLAAGVHHLGRLHRVRLLTVLAEHTHQRVQHYLGLRPKPTPS